MKKLLIGLFAVMLLLPAAVSAQTPTADDETPAGQIRELAGVEPAARAESEFLSQGIAEDEPLALQFTVEIYESEDDAIKLMETVREHYIDIILESYDVEQVSEAPEVEEVDAPEIGDEQFALTMTAELEDFSATYGVVIFRSGLMVVFNLAGGLGGDMIESLIPHLELIDANWSESDQNEEVDPETIVPLLEDLPEGWIADEDI